MVTALCSLLSAAWSGHAPGGEFYAEESVKAAFVLRFAGYVQWPEEEIHGDHFIIAVLGASKVAAQIQALAEGRSAMNRPIQVRRVASTRDLGDASILYVGTDRRGELNDLLAPLAGRSLLVVSSEDAALTAGSTINLLVADQRVRFEVSLPTARQARLKISSELLSLAVRVQK
jgi:hypothetical protein